VFRRIEENVNPDDAPVEVVREVFRENFLERVEHFSKTLFHYLLNRLGAQQDEYAIDYCINQLKARPQETQPVLDYFGMVKRFDKVFPALA
jgi:hypothetical protein